MNILNLEHVSKSFENRVLLEDVTLGLEDTDKIGVIGINGTGKSTLLSITAGTLAPDEGKVVRGKEIRISYLSQNPEFDNSLSVLENVARTVNGKDTFWDTTGEAKAMLQRLGIEDPGVSPEILSGGQRKRAALAAALLTPCDLLILDEPTNHLDNDMIEWLEDYLIRYRGAILMVTHDRYFLDSVTDQIVEIDRGKLYRYAENYSGYLELRQQRMDYALAAERKMAALYRKDLAWIIRGARARSTKQKAHIRRFEELRDRDKIVEDRNVAINAQVTSARNGMAGGLAGMISGAKLADCYTSNEIVSSGNCKQVGGLVGYMLDNSKTTNTLDRCLNTGQVIMATATGHEGLYGIRFKKTVFTGCYYDKQITNTALDDSLSYMAATTSQLTSGVPLTGYSTDVWTFKKGLYPQLKALAGTDVSNLSVAPVMLADGETTTKVKTAFTVSTQNGIDWYVYENDALTKNATGLVINDSTKREAITEEQEQIFLDFVKNDK